MPGLSFPTGYRCFPRFASIVHASPSIFLPWIPQPIKKPDIEEEFKFSPMSDLSRKKVPFRQQ
ncbi:hypothetical protein JOE21_002286 [Desmospora profundinema]|uniref:Uncharacterized protein n=1 Tax=Desmospora profundinema TaxID=1571184 RepID=A0ABU1INB8_9BACL|nr:hypothetical protein [Desmospora profundinema]